MKNLDSYVKIFMEFKNPTQVQMVYVTNALFVGRANIIDHALYMSTKVDRLYNNRDEFKSKDWLKSVQTTHRLSREPFQDVYFDVVRSPKD
jgi:hypothetical protein